jgi:hypothetical protein
LPAKQTLQHPKKYTAFFLWSNSQQQDHISHSQLNLLLRNGFAERR